MTEQQMRDECSKIQSEWQMGGLTGGIYEDFAVELSRRAVMAERERAARVCDDEARIRSEAGAKHPEDSESRGRCYAAARSAINCAKGVRNGEVVEPAAPMKAT